MLLVGGLVVVAGHWCRQLVVRYVLFVGFDWSCVSAVGVGCRWLFAGCWLVVTICVMCGVCLVGGWWLTVGCWCQWLVVCGWCRLLVLGDWRLAVG